MLGVFRVRGSQRTALSAPSLRVFFFCSKIPVGVHPFTMSTPKILYVATASVCSLASPLRFPLLPCSACFTARVLRVSLAPLPRLFERFRIATKPAYQSPPFCYDRDLRSGCAAPTSRSPMSPAR
jgi:hypothetical protein